MEELPFKDQHPRPDNLTFPLWKHTSWFCDVNDFPGLCLFLGRFSFFNSGGFSYAYISADTDKATEIFVDLVNSCSLLKATFFYFALQFSLPRCPWILKDAFPEEPMDSWEAHLHAVAPQAGG